MKFWNCMEKVVDCIFYLCTRILLSYKASDSTEIIFYCKSFESLGSVR
ncbi:hypothetical protein X975_19622, partial [Stegodyphus mimosarum]